MHALIATHLTEITALCRRFGVARLDLFGSATRVDFELVNSDVDLVVDFLPEAKKQAFDNYFGLRESLERLLDRPIDLLTDTSIRNPYLRRAIETSRLPIYGARI